MNRESELAAIFVEMAEALVHDYDLQDFLQILVDRVADLVDAAAVGVLMTDESGGLQLTAATSRAMERLEDFELVQEQGPCFDAYASGEQVSEPDLDANHGRWPEFTRGALALGYRSVHGFPLRVRDESLGALNVFFAEAGDFDQSDIRALQAMADVAAIGISQERLTSRRRALQQDAIAELGRVALDGLSAEAVLTRVVDTVREVLGAPAVTLLEVTPAGGLGARGDAGAVPDGTETPVAPGALELAARALEKRRTLVVPTPAGESAPVASLPDDVAAMAAVIRGRHRDFGVLLVWCDDRDRTFGDDDVAFLESVATLVASIVARQEVETQLRQAQKLEAIGQLAGGVAHDFNNLLQIIHGNAELLALRSPTDEMSEILTAAEHGRRLVEPLLSFGRQQPATTCLVALNDKVARVIDMLNRMVGDTITIDTDLAPDVRTVTVDETQFEQAIINLVINARDVMPDGGHITVSTALADSAELPFGVSGSFVRLTVADTGPGMNDDVLAQAFDPFFTTKPEGKGTGLGLCAVYGAVTSAGGHVDVRTSVGGGTAFDLLLPHGSAATDTHDVPVHQPTPTLNASVLVVEDRDEIRQLVTTTLKHLGLTVLSAHDAESALALIADDGPPDLLVTDLTLPGVQGPALAEQVRAIHPDVRVLYMSGYAGQHLDDSDGTAFLQKPFSLTNLTEQVEALLR